jgi:hypothetical protein
MLHEVVGGYNPHFEEPYCLHVQGQEVQEALCFLYIVYFLNCLILKITMLLSFETSGSVTTTMQRNISEELHLQL